MNAETVCQRQAGDWRDFARQAACAARNTVRDMFCNVGRGALGLVFPQACISCGQEMGAGDSMPLDAPFCQECFAELRSNVRSQCARCAAPLPMSVVQSQDIGAETPKQCAHCSDRRYWFHRAIAAGTYTGQLRKLVLRMKRAEQNSASLAMGRFVWHCCGDQLAAARPDVIVPIPMHWRRHLHHGTNSAALLAEVLSRRLGAPRGNSLLRRNRNTAPQFTLSPPQRRANVRGCFVARGRRRLENAHVLLVDDIMTSGATCNEAARVLRKAGARRVTIVVAARAVSQ